MEKKKKVRRQKPPQFVNKKVLQVLDFKPKLGASKGWKSKWEGSSLRSLRTSEVRVKARSPPNR